MSLEPRKEIVRLGGVDAGMLAVEETDEEIWLAVIEIHPRFQRRGLGTEIIRSVLDRGYGEARHAAGASNQSSRALTL